MTADHKRPILHVASESQRPRNRLGETTPEQRRRMTVAELIEVMGPAHVNHADFKPKLRSLLPMPNLAGQQPVIEEHHVSIWKLMLWALRWVFA